MALRWIFTADSRPFRRGLDQMRTEAKGFGKSLTRTMAGVFGSAAIIGGFRSWMQNIDALDKRAKKLGTTASELAKVELVAKKNAVSAQQLTTLLVRLERRFGEAARGSASFATALENLGLERIGASRPAEAIIELSRAWKQAEGSGTEYADLLKVLDTEARELIPLLRQGPEALAAEFDKAKAPLDSTVARIAALNDKLTESKNIISAELSKALAGLILIIETLGRALGVLIIAFQEFFQTARTGFTSLLTVMRGAATRNVATMASGLAAMTNQFTNSFTTIREAAEREFEATRQAALDAFAATQKLDRGAGDPLAGQVFGGSPFDPSIEARNRANLMRIRMAEDAAGIGGKFDLSSSFSLADLAKDRAVPFGEDAATFAAQPNRVEVSSLRSIGGATGAGGLAQNIAREGLRINSLQLATLEKIAINTTKTQNGTKAVAEPNVP